MRDVPPDLAHRLRLHKQEHVLFGWEKLDVAARGALVSQLAGIDFEQLDELYKTRDAVQSLPPEDRIKPVVMESPEDVDAHQLKLGHRALAEGQVAVLLVAGGQGSRLGFEKPKGMFPIGPVSNSTLFRIHAEKTLALARRYGKPVPFLVMTSPQTHDETESYFRENAFFGLGTENVFFFQQGTMPAVDIETGKLLLEKPGVVFSSPNGHGGTLTAVSECGLLDELRGRGIRHLFYFQVDNPLVKIADPVFLARHIAVKSEVSAKAIEKAFPQRKRWESSR